MIRYNPIEKLKSGVLNKEGFKDGSLIYDIWVWNDKSIQVDVYSETHPPKTSAIAIFKSKIK